MDNYTNRLEFSPCKQSHTQTHQIHARNSVFFHADLRAHVTNSPHKRIGKSHSAIHHFTNSKVRNLDNARR
jgi:hypothetical protein